MEAFFFCKILLRNNFTIRRTFVRLQVQFFRSENFSQLRISYTASPNSAYLCTLSGLVCPLWILFPTYYALKDFTTRRIIIRLRVTQSCALAQFVHCELFSLLKQATILSLSLFSIPSDSVCPLWMFFTTYYTLKAFIFEGFYTFMLCIDTFMTNLKFSKKSIDKIAFSHYNPYCKRFL